MPTRCMYDGKRLIPAPFVSLTKEFLRTGDGTLIGSTWRGVIQGTIVTHMGSPNSSGVFWTLGGYPSDEVISTDSKLGTIFRKQEAIRTLFSIDGKQLEFQSADGTQPMKCNPRITGIELPENQWFNTCPYTVNFEADVIYVNGQPYGEDTFDGYITGAEETWQIETQEDQLQGFGLRTFRVTHNVSATGKRFYDDTGTLSKPAWEQARDWALSKIGFDNNRLNSSGLPELTENYLNYNHVRSENIGETDGNYSITESWILASGATIESFDISTKTSIDSALTSVSIDGQITGLERRDAQMNLIETKYDNANNYFTSLSGTIISRASLYSNKTLNIIPLSSTVGKNPYQGTITYSYEFNDRPSNLFTNSLSETISIQDLNNADVIAIVPVLGRTAGPVLQDIGTKREKVRTLNIEVVMPTPSGTALERYNSMPSGEAEILALTLKPNGTQVYQVDNNYSYEITTGRYTFSRQWIYE